MVPAQAPDVKQIRGGRTRPSFRVATPCYTKVTQRHKSFVLDSKPGVLKHVSLVDQKAWRQYQAHLERTTPLERAEFYARQMEARGVTSPWILEKHLNEPFARVWRALKLLQLPEPIRKFLKEHRTPEYVRYFTERKLLGLLKLGDTRAAWRQFRTMVDAAEHDAGLWKVRDQGEGSPPSPQDVR
jgi:hypothetical protein